jgi:alcohol dehydrogenase (NADP+)
MPESIASQGYAARSAQSPLAPFNFARRVPGPHDVQIDILFCGVCHSDLHTVRDEWGGTVFPVVPGHEIVGRVSQVGAQVSRFKVGQIAGVGCMVDSCQTCASCAEVLRGRLHRHLQRRRKTDWRHDLRRLRQQHRGA